MKIASLYLSLSLAALYLSTGQAVLSTKDNAKRSVTPKEKVKDTYTFEGSRSVPLQMDVGASKHITICTGLSRSISCRDGSNVAITYAFWGRTSDKICPSDDGDPVTDCETADETEGLVKGYCEGKEQCMLEAKHHYLQRNETRHCPGVNKYLIVNYTCIPESKGVVLCDSEETVIDCNAGWKIEVTDAFWGRRVSAKYCGTGDSGVECESTDSAIKVLKSQCDGSTSCRIQANTEKFDDKRNNCQGLLKYLLVNYACRPKDGHSKQGKPGDDENESTVENKLLADTSSKELMGLLEKHLNELQAKPTKAKTEGKAESSKADVEDKPHAEVAPKSSSSAKSSKESKGVTSSTATPKQGKTSKKTTHIVPVDSDISKYTSGPLSARTLGKSGEGAGNESPAMDIQETESSKKTQENVPAEAAAAVKQEVPKATVEPSEDSYEVTEPATVKSILARAKEVLKTLDDDRDDVASTSDTLPNQSQSAKATTKKSDIVRKLKKEDESDDKSVKQIAKLAQSLVKTASKSSIQASTSGKDSSGSSGAQAMSATGQKGEKKPLPGPQKTGLKATGPGTAGIGNTP